MEDPTQPPGTLSPARKLWETIKHVGATALKWAVTGALIGGAIAGAIPLLGTVASGLTAWIPVIGPKITALAAEGFFHAFATGALGVGAAVGVLGLAKGLSGASDAVDDAEDRNIAMIQRAKTREMQMAMMDQQMAQRQVAMGHQLPVQPAIGQTLPNMGPNVGRGA
jgi:hypothetical protein